jgi:hypothetical protein
MGGRTQARTLLLSHLTNDIILLKSVTRRQNREAGQEPDGGEAIALCMCSSTRLDNYTAGRCCQCPAVGQVHSISHAVVL